MTERPLDWIPEVESSLALLDEKPQFPLPAPLDWEMVEKQLQQLLERPSFKLAKTIKGWKLAKELVPQVKEGHLTLAVEWQPLKTPAFFTINEASVKEILSLLFDAPQIGNYFYDSPYAEAFIYYAATEVLRVLEKQSFAAPLTPRTALRADELFALQGTDPLFHIELALELEQKSFWASIFLPAPFCKEWKSAFAHLPTAPPSKKRLEKLMVDVAVEVGHSRLKLKEWERIKPGDLVMLDHCSYDPLEQKGGVVLMLNQKPLLRGRIKDGGIKLTSYPLYEEVSDAMEDEDEDEFEDDAFDEEIEEGTFEEEAEEPTFEKQTPSLTDLPVHLTVEIGRLRMSAAALLELEPGNLLELNVSVEQGVDLVVNGKKVGRGELIRMGDLLGVRVLSL